MHNYYYDENKPIVVTNETRRLTPHSFGLDFNLNELESIKDFFQFVDKDKQITILDIGAQTGLYSLYAKYLPNATFHSFEPFPQSFKLLNKNLRLNEINNVNTYNIAISDKKAEQILKCCKSHNGLHTLCDNVCTFLDIEDIAVECDTIDNLFKDTKVDFIKIDVEGYEYNVLLGGMQTIKKWKPIIQMEYNPINMNNNNIKPEDINSLMDAFGYQCISYDKEERLYMYVS